MAAGNYLSKRKAAQWLDVSEKTIDRLRAAGELDWIPVAGRLVRIDRASLEAYAARRQAKLAPAPDPFAIPALEAIRAEKAARRAVAAKEAA